VNLSGQLSFVQNCAFIVRIELTFTLFSILLALGRGLEKNTPDFKFESYLSIQFITMRRVIASLNMTLDGFCDHTSMIADEEIHEHFTEVLHSSGVTLYGRITYELMESYWPNVVKNPTGIRSMNEFAVALNNIPKIVFSRSLKEVDWKTASLATGELKEEVLKLKDQPGKDILVGSRSLIVALANLDLVDEYQIVVHPVLMGSGLPLFKSIANRLVLKLTKTKTFGSGAMLVCYTPS